MNHYFNEKGDLVCPDGHKIKGFHCPKAAMLFARRMENLGFKVQYASTFLEVSEVWMHTVRYWREEPQESTFQDEANDAYADFRRAGGY